MHVQLSERKVAVNNGKWGEMIRIVCDNYLLASKTRPSSDDVWE